MKQLGGGGGGGGKAENILFPFVFLKWGIQSFVILTADLMLMSNTVSKTSIEGSLNSLLKLEPALLNNISSRPNFSTASFTIFSQTPSVRKSPERMI